MFRNAIVRKPGKNFPEGLTSGKLGVPSYEKALDQHHGYCQALELCGLRVTVLEADLRHADSTFVEDTAVLTPTSAILTRPGAPSRQGEVAEIHEPLGRFFPAIHQIRAPGTLEGGDICQAENHFFIGISERTNEEGGRQLAELLAHEGRTSSFVDIRGFENVLHLKSGIAYLGDNHLVISEELREHPHFRGYNLIGVNARESYAANCLRINDRVLVPEGFPRLRESIERLGYAVLALDMSEFEKMDGGLSCLSLRF
ncbi:MAG: arginine deiminase family protein [Terriglobia bacterium]